MAQPFIVLDAHALISWAHGVPDHRTVIDVCHKLKMHIGVPPGVAIELARMASSDSPLRPFARRAIEDLSQSEFVALALDGLQLQLVEIHANRIAADYADRGIELADARLLLETAYHECAFLVTGKDCLARQPAGFISMLLAKCGMTGGSLFRLEVGKAKDFVLAAKRVGLT